MRRLLVLLVLIVSLLPAVAPAGNRKPTALGKEYFVMYPKDSWAENALYALVNSPVQQKIAIDVRGSTGYRNILKRTRLNLGVSAPVLNQSETIIRNGAAHIIAQSPVTVHAVFGHCGIGGTYTALPTSAWGKEYYVVGQPEGVHTDSIAFMSSGFAVCAMRDGTVVTITPTAPTAMGKPAGVPFTVTLQKGDVYEVWTQDWPKASPQKFNDCIDDFSGTHITSSFPLGVISFSAHNSLPCGNGTCGDYSVEMLPPVFNWGTEYVVVPTIDRPDTARTETIRCVIGGDNDTITQRDTNGTRVIGVYPKGRVLDWPTPITTPFVLNGTVPFEVMMITPTPDRCDSVTPVEPYTNSMILLPAGDQWGDYIPFSIPDSSTGKARIYFHDTDFAKIYFNGSNISTSFGGKSNHVAPGCSYISIDVPPGYNELTGAACGGTIVGYGACRVPKAGIATVPPQLKSFGHSIGINALPRGDPDTIPPRFTSAYFCGHWNDTVYDDHVAPPASGMLDVYMVDSLNYNMRITVNSFQLGDPFVPFSLDVINLLQDAFAFIVMRDGAGNETYTTFAYHAIKLSGTPDTIDFGFVHGGDTVRACITLSNTGDSVVTLTNIKLRYGPSSSGFAIDPPLPGNTISLGPNKTKQICIFGVSPASFSAVCKEDSLFATACKQFLLATLRICNKREQIYVDDWCVQAPAPVGGDARGTLTLQALGSPDDSLHVSKLQFQGSDAADFHLDYSAITPIEYSYDPASDPRGAWVIPESTKVRLPVVFRPTSLLPQPLRQSTLHITSDAGTVQKDTAFVCAVAVAPGVIAQGIRFGRHLLGSITDSTWWIWNSGTADDTISALALLP